LDLSGVRSLYFAPLTPGSVHANDISIQADERTTTITRIATAFLLDGDDFTNKLATAINKNMIMIFFVLDML
jgi:hypothetical protein